MQFSEPMPFMKIHLSARTARLAAAALVASAAGCSYVDQVPSDPNSLPSASAAQLFTGIQLDTWLLNEGQIARLSSIWLNQQAGIDRQFSDLDVYRYGEDVASLEMSELYPGGGLVDIRKARAETDSLHFDRFNAVLKIHEAFDFGLGAAVWGDLPYSRALGGPENPQSPLDRQEDIYAAVQALLDQAIAQLGHPALPGEATILSDRDARFHGDPDAWRKVAYSLKARLYLHWVEAQDAGVPAAATACGGGSCVQKALAAARNGIDDPAGDWRSVHSTASTEANWWYQFNSERSGYVGAGALLVGFLSARNDPRLAIYFLPNAAGAYEGSRPGQNDGSASPLNTHEGGIAPAEAGIPLVTCGETRLIAAEASYRLGDEAGANAALQAGIGCEERRFAVAIPRPPVLGGPALLREIMLQKYAALFLNAEAWNDYKRTCLPNVAALVKAGSPVQDVPIPARLLYGQAERQSNPNLPPPEQQPLRNRNDPVPCSDPSMTGLPGA